MNLSLIFFAICLCFSTENQATILSKNDQGPVGKNSTIRIQKGERIVLLGDSLAEGMASPFAKLAKKNGYMPGIHALHGTTMDYWSKRIQEIMINNRPKLVIVSLGTNDAGSSNPEIQRIHAKKIRDSVKKYGGKLLWITPLNLPSKFRGQQGIRKILEEEISPEDRYDSTKLELQMAKDKIHLTRKGYEDWICTVWTYLATLNYVYKD